VKALTSYVLRQSAQGYCRLPEIEIIGRDQGRIVLTAGYQSYGEPVRRSRSKSGATSEIWLSSIRLRPESKVGSEMQRRYGAANRPAKGRKGPAPH
jgi:hypothetical protein